LSQKAFRRRANLRYLGDLLAEENDVDHRVTDASQDSKLEGVRNPFDRAKELVERIGRKAAAGMEGVLFCGYSTREIAFELNHQDRLAEIAEDYYPPSADEDPQVHDYYRRERNQIDAEIEWLWTKHGEARDQRDHEVWVFLTGKDIDAHPYMPWVPRRPHYPLSDLPNNFYDPGQRREIYLREDSFLGDYSSF
jgi:hypothetical protein